MANPNPLQLQQKGYRLPAGEWFNSIINRVNGLVAGTLTGNFNALNFTVSGTFTSVPQTLAATGATQGNAAQITKSVVMVTVTASTQGVKLPTAATGLRVIVCAASAKGVKVYPFLGDRIQGAATNAAVALVLNKSSIYIAADATNWRVVKGA